MSARLPTAFKTTIETMITNCIAGINNKTATLSFVVTTNRIEADPTTWGSFTLSWKILS
jgi:hypothetical protein